jgi:hypothetical protein
MEERDLGLFRGIHYPGISMEELRRTRKRRIAGLRAKI